MQACSETQYIRSACVVLGKLTHSLANPLCCKLHCLMRCTESLQDTETPDGACRRGAPQKRPLQPPASQATSATSASPPLSSNLGRPKEVVLMAADTQGPMQRPLRHLSLNPLLLPLQKSSLDLNTSDSQHLLEHEVQGLRL